MKRKVALIGPSTLMVSLPSKFVKKFGIKKGDELDVEEKGSSLTINIDKITQGKSKNLDVHELDVMLNRFIGACYKKGYDKITVNFSSSNQLKSMYNVIGTTWTGFEVVEHGKSHIVIKQVTELNKNDLASMINRSILFLISTSDEALKAIEDRNNEYLKTVILRDPTQNKYCDFCRRVLNKFDVEDTNAKYYLSEQIERIGDFYRDLAKYILENRINVGHKIIELNKEVNEYLRSFYSLYNKIDTNSFETFGKDYKKISKKIDENLVKAEKKDIQILAYLKMINEAIFNMNGALLVMHLEHI
ncbi:MAG TPA: AbrB/MazE/SpoVT family DNA-binding domain-containing protein [Candidatus Nanoarchaeia archaeon]|nr:AbrB/MazE/SpoVT family DNA-binding domain-containing protein [Candidatus Nanoarchaeia archaeon]